MSNSNMLISFSFFFLFYISFASSSSFNATHKCSPQQSLDLLLFKENMSSINYSGDYVIDAHCKRWLGSGYRPIMMNWNKNTDCCKWNGVTCNHLTGDVIGIDLNCGMLQGTIHPNTTLFHLPHLQTLNLAYNDFTDSQLPRNIGGLSNSLTLLNLSFCGFSGDISGEILYLPKLVTLDLSRNDGLQLQPSILKNLLLNSTHLRELLLKDVDISWILPRYLNIPTSLKSLDLSNTSLQGKLPDNIFGLHYLETLGMSNNVDITGPLPNVNKSNNIPLNFLDLSYANLSGEIPESIGHLKFLNKLRLHSCGLVGSIPKSLVNLRHLIILDLSYNKLNGTLPSLLFTLPYIEYINLQSNQIKGPFPPSICGMTGLQYLNISNNSFDGVLPQCLGNITSSLVSLNVKSNKLQGSFPSSICGMTGLQILDISNNSFDGVLPQCLGNITSSLEIFNVKSNKLQGSFPSSLCNMSLLFSLDMSDNSFSGAIPHCFGNISSFLTMVDMGNNDFHGIIPNVYKCGRLQGLILKGNRLHGEVPSSLSKCQSLMVLDLGNNQLNGTFPGWLGVLPMLQVLVLKSNKFYGSIETPSTLKSAFPSMRVLVLSHNEFVGLLPRTYLQNFSAMKNTIRSNTTLGYLLMGSGYYSITTSVKGADLEFPQLSVDYIILDLSNNRFEGEIPSVIGCLTSLIVLDLSHNNLTGQIPSVLGNLSEIESLDLSWNQLTGEIPQSLAGLKFLEFLNLSQNHLKGRIPSGGQFNTFGTSFEGNPKLCGFPLQKTCELPHEPQFEGDGDGDGDGERGFTWRVVMLGFGCGTLIGLVMGYVMLSTGTPKWFNAIADAGEHMIQTKGNKRRYVYIGR